EHDQDQGNDQPNYDWMQDDSSDSASTVQATDVDADSSDWSSGSDLDSDLDWDPDQLALFDFGIDDLGNGDDGDDDYVDGIDDFDDGMDNPDYSGDYSGDYSVDWGSSGGDCDCLVYNDYPPPYSDSAQQDSPQDRDWNGNDRTDNGYNTAFGV